jgi:hypothetical protein
MPSMTRNTKAENDLGLVPRRPSRAEIFSVRLSGEDARKLSTLAKRLKVGRSAMARLILEKFIKDHDPEKGAKR